MENRATKTDRFAERTSLARHVAGTLQDEIVEGRLSVSERLPSEAELAERFDVSQPTVREALKILAAKKLIRSKRGPNGGVFVNAPSISVASQMLQEITTWFVGLGVFDLKEIVETRLLIGRICVRLAAERATEDDLAVMEDTLAAFAEAGLSDEDFCRLDVAFHHAIAQATGNNEIRFIMLVVNDSLIPATNMISFAFRERDRVVGMHADILSALRAKDVDAAVTAFEGLIAYQSKVYDKALAAREKAASSQATR
ncbi:FadR/GntR family transcriptional regulator [Microbaculum sp. FT89]|uniref:FadR/GntR family transcriptional regulator n=1 Tax=Microbaculum sp. FT89 TaxID=3447298 RepID=UPI003F535FC8